MLVAPLADAMSDFLISDLFRAPRQPVWFLEVFLGNGQVFSMQLLNPFSSAALPGGIEEASLIKQIGVEHHL